MINKKLSALICFAVLAGTSQASYAESVRLMDENAFLYYESRAEIKAPEHRLAGFISSDYLTARDEFTKYDLMKTIKPALNKKLSEAASNDSVFVRVGTQLGEYDFDKGAFPTGFSESTFIPFNHGYALTFKNASDAAFIPVEMNKARALSGELRSGRGASVILHVKVVGTEETRLNWNHNKAINGKITRMEVQLDSGTEVGSVTVR